MIGFIRRGYHCIYGEPCNLSDDEIRRVVRGVTGTESIHEAYGWVMFDLRMQVTGIRGGQF